MKLLKTMSMITIMLSMSVLLCPNKVNAKMVQACVHTHSFVLDDGCCYDHYDCGNSVMVEQNC